MYVLRVKGVKGYFSGTYPYDRLVKVLGTNIEEAKKTIEAQKEEINTLKGYLRKFGFTDG